MKSPEELKPLFDDLMYMLGEFHGANGFLSGMVTMLSLVLEVPDHCGMKGCQEDHAAGRDRFIADMQQRAIKLRKLRGAHKSARSN